jgi:hypothetical protein
MSYAIFDKSLSNIAFNFNVGVGTSRALSLFHVHGNEYISGNLGIGTTLPRRPLHVEGITYFGSNVGIGSTTPLSLVDIRANNTTGAIRIFQQSPFGDVFNASCSSTQAPNLIIKADGTVGIGTTLPLQKFHVEGSQYIGGFLGIGVNNPQASLHLKGTTKGIPCIYSSGSLSGTVFTFTLDTMNYKVHEIYFKYYAKHSAGTIHSSLLRVSGNGTNFPITGYDNNIWVLQRSYSGCVVMDVDLNGDGPLIADSIDSQSNFQSAGKITVFNRDTAGKSQVLVDFAYANPFDSTCRSMGNFTCAAVVSDIQALKYYLFDWNVSNKVNGSEGEYYIVGYPA